MSNLSTLDKKRISDACRILRQIHDKKFRIFTNDMQTINEFIYYCKKITPFQKEELFEQFREACAFDEKLSIPEKTDTEVFLCAMNDQDIVDGIKIQYNIILREFFTLKTDEPVTISFKASRYEYRYTKISNEKYLFDSTNPDFGNEIFSCSFIFEIKLINYFYSVAKFKNKVTDIINLREIIRSLNLLILEHFNTIDLKDIKFVQISFPDGTKSKNIEIIHNQYPHFQIA